MILLSGCCRQIRACRSGTDGKHETTAPSGQNSPRVYRVFRQLESGELIHVASRDQLDGAAEFVEALRAAFPAEYVVRDSDENDIELPERPRI